VKRAILYSIILWPTMALITVPLYLLGWILVPIAAALKAYYFEDTLTIYGESRRMTHFTWDFMFLWDNWEDGILAGKHYKDFKNDFLQIIFWSCQRNPINNLRIVPYLSCKIQPEKIGYVLLGNSKRFFCWQLPYTVFYWEFVFIKWPMRFWCGWKLWPEDKQRTEFGYRQKGAGFTCQVKVVK
jgi:hypothetical protein